MALYDELIEEIDRLLNCPYPSLLKHLHDLVLLDSGAAVKRWASSRPCQVRSLVSLILSSRSPQKLLLVARFSTAKIVRDEVLDQQPRILYDYIKHDEEAAIALLQHDLPPNITLPQECQFLLQGVIENACRQPSEDSIRTLHKTLTVLPLINLMPKNLLNELEDQLLETVLKTSATDSKDDGLYALATMSLMVHQNTKDCTKRSWEPTRSRQLFQGERAHRMLHLLALKALFYCRKDDREAMKVLAQLAERFSPDMWSSWCSRNLQIFTKLERELDPRPCLLPFLLTMAGPIAVPSAIRRRILADPTTLVRILCTCSQQQFGLLAAASCTGDVLNLISSVNVRVLTANHAEIIGFLHAYRHNTAQNNDEGNELSELASRTIIHLEQILQASKTSTNEDICICVSERALRTFVHVGASFILSMISHIDVGQMNRLIELHSNSAPNDSSCQRLQTAGIRAQELEKIPQASEMQNCWQNDLSDLLKQRMTHEQEALVSFISRICHELEERCHNVEEPLRREQSRHEELNARYESSARELISVQEKEIQLQALLGVKEQELDTVQSHLQRCRHEKMLIADDLTQARQEYELSKAALMEEMKTLQDRHNMVLLEHAAAAARQQEDIENVQAQLRDKMQEVLSVRDCVDKLESTITQLRSNELILNEKVSELQDQLQAEAGAHLQAVEELRSEARSDEQASTMRLDQERQKLLEAEKMMGDAAARHREEISEMGSRLEELSSEAQIKNDALAAEMAKNEELFVAYDKTKKELRRLKQIQADMMRAMGMTRQAAGSTQSQQQEPSGVVAEVRNDHADLQPSLRHANPHSNTALQKSKNTTRRATNHVIRRPLQAITPNVSPVRKRDQISSKMPDTQVFSDDELLYSTLED